MGLFSSSSKVYVDSVAYNLGGPLEDRPNFIKTTVITSVLQNGSVGSDVVSAHIAGPGIDQRMFYRWSKREYLHGTCVGAVNQALDVSTTVAQTEIESTLTLDPGESITVNQAFIDTGDIVFFAQSWLLENSPEKFSEPWLADYDPVAGQMVISYPVGTDDLSVLVNYQRQAKYIFAFYTKTFADLTERGYLFIYKMGGTNAVLNALDANIALKPEIFPVIPLRLFNKMIDDPEFTEDFPIIKRAYKKAIGSKIEDILLSINDNPNIGDIDHCFLVHGVPLNATDKASLKYLFDFFKNLIPDQKMSPTDFGSWVAYSLGYESDIEAFTAWTEAQLDPLSLLYDTPQPALPTITNLEQTRFEVKTLSELQYEAHLGWVTIQESLWAGLGKPDAVVGSLWVEKLTDLVIPAMPLKVEEGWDFVGGGSVGRFKIWWQETATSHRHLTVYGCYHENFVYEGNAVTISALEALNDPFESGFIVPMHYPTLTAMSLANSTQLAISNRILVFNSYRVVKTRWYQTGFFRFVFAVLLAVVISLVFPAAIGLLGTNLAVGSAVGLSGTAALIAGATINAIASIVLMQVLEVGATALFGEKIGLIIAAIAGFVVTGFSNGTFSTSNSFATNLGELSRAQNLLQLTNAISGGVSRWSQMVMADIQKDLFTAAGEYKTADTELQNKLRELLGYGKGEINPLLFLELDSTIPDPMGMIESSETFLIRTKLVGSDIVAMSLDMIHNFPAISLELPKPSF